MAANSGGVCFLDANYAIALINTKDQHHPRAVELARKLSGKVTLITTDAVFFEVANALSKPRFRKPAAEFLQSLLLADDTEMVSVSGELFSAAFELYCKRGDKAWSLTDCASFVVMSDRGITDALTNDEHFEQAGFTAMLQS